MFGELSRDRDSKQTRLRLGGEQRKLEHHTFTSQLLPFFSLIVEEHVLPNLAKPNSTFEGI